MTRLKKMFMYNYNGEDWVILDDFINLKEKLKKTQKEYAKTREQLEKKLAIATDALSMLAHLRKEFDNRYREFAENALKQIEEVK